MYKQQHMCGWYWKLHLHGKFNEIFNENEIISIQLFFMTSVWMDLEEDSAKKRLTSVNRSPAIMEEIAQI